MASVLLVDFEEMMMTMDNLFATMVAEFDLPQDEMIEILGPSLRPRRFGLCCPSDSHKYRIREVC